MSSVCDDYRNCKVVPCDGMWEVVGPDGDTIAAFASYAEAFDWVGAACNGGPFDDGRGWLADYERREAEAKAELLARYPVPEPEDDDELDPANRLWWDWYRLGYDCTGAIPGPELTPVDRVLAESGYDSGFRDGLEARYEYLERLWDDDAGRDRGLVEEVRGILVGHPGWADFEASDYSSEGH